MYATTAARFKRMGIPAFPMAGFLVFWGGFQHGFWGYSHNPVEYAKTVKCPVILMYGQKDETVNEGDINLMFENFSSRAKELKKYPNAAHESYLNQYKVEWTQHISQFMEKLN
jgi:alpha-beta hydrolase superfamily lysophospholipase